MSFIHPTTDSENDDAPSEVWRSLFAELVYHERVCSNCFRDRRGIVEEDWYRSHGGSRRAQLADEFCIHGGTGTPENDGTVSWHWDEDPLPVRGERSFVRKLDRLYDRIEELAAVEVDRDGGFEAAIERKTDSEYAGRDVDCFVVGLEAGLSSADLDLSD